MRFEEALVELRKGKNIHCSSGLGITFSLSELDELSYTINSSMSSFTVMEAIIKGNWEIVEEPGKTFDQVFDAFTNGKKIKRKFWRSCDYISTTTNICSLSAYDLLSKDWEVIE